MTDQAGAGGMMALITWRWLTATMKKKQRSVQQKNLMPCAFDAAGVGRCFERPEPGIHPALT